jgi:hypothetical protein
MVPDSAVPVKNPFKGSGGCSIFLILRQQFTIHNLAELGAGYMCPALVRIGIEMLPASVGAENERTQHRRTLWAS